MFPPVSSITANLLEKAIRNLKINGALKSKNLESESAMEGAEMESNNGALNSEIAIRCAKAAFVLSSLKSFPSHSLKIMNNDDEEEKTNMEREIQNLKIALAWERMKNRRIKLCGLMELILQVLVLFLLSSFFLMLFVKI